MNKQDLLRGVAGYLAAHPEEVLRAAKNSMALRFGLPLQVFRWAASQATGRSAPKDVQIEAVPPGIRVGATLDLMGAVLRASAVIYVDEVKIDSEQVRFEIRLADVVLRVLRDSDSPVVTLVKSGALDLSKPGNLVAYMPKRPPMIVEAGDDRIVLDLMKHPALAGNATVGKALGLLTPLMTVTGIHTDWEHLDVQCSMFREGVSGALSSIRQHL